MENRHHLTWAIVSIVAIIFICLTYAHIAVDNNKRVEQVERIRVELQHEIEMTKQRAIIEDHARKRKIWERAMPNED